MDLNENAPTIVKIADFGSSSFTDWTIDLISYCQLIHQLILFRSNSDLNNPLSIYYSDEVIPDILTTILNIKKKEIGEKWNFDVICNLILSHLKLFNNNNNNNYNNNHNNNNLNNN